MAARGRMFISLVVGYFPRDTGEDDAYHNDEDGDERPDPIGYGAYRAGLVCRDGGGNTWFLEQRGNTPRDAVSYVWEWYDYKDVRDWKKIGVMLKKRSDDRRDTLTRRRAR